MADLLEMEVAFYGAAQMSPADSLRVAYELDEPDEPGDDDDQEPDDKSDDPAASSAELQGGKQARADIWFQHLRYRVARFADNYPFAFQGNALVLRDDLGPRHATYLFLLICSRLAIIERKGGHRQRLASLFEVLSAEAVRRLAPGMVVRLFGANSEDRRNYYGTKAVDAFSKLAADLCEELTPAGQKELGSDTGERGIDVVGYFPWPDKSSGVFALFGQCAAMTEEWPNKAYESAPMRHRGLINFRHDPANVLFIPLCFRTSSGGWVSETEPWTVILVDRVRLMDLLKEELTGVLLGNGSFAALLAEAGLAGRLIGAAAA